ncbi:rRNA maturation RNase YbeY [Pelagibacteraceae bacterium]|nr:rRNA maturation RNase YbeY [Pelagibacteraceae bacterium]
MFKVNIIVEDSKWRKEIPTIEKMLKKNVKKIYSSIDRTSKKKNLEISVLLTNKTKMKKLNKDFRRTLKDTDVLSFPHHEKNFFLKRKLPTMGNIYLGDLAFSYDYIKKQKTNFVEYVNKIFIHGCLHLVGYEHDNLKNYKEMHLLERKLLAIV